MISALLMAAEFGIRVICMITLMSLCCSFDGRRPRYLGHIADGTVWDINSTCAEFGPKCLHILGIQHLTVSDTKSYLYGKYNVSVLKTLRAGDFSSFHRLCRAWWHVWAGYGSRAVDEDETSEGNPGNSNGDAVDVVPPVGMAEPGPREPVVPCELSEIGNSSTRPMPPKRTACYQQREWQPMHFLGKTLPSH